MRKSSIQNVLPFFLKKSPKTLRKKLRSGLEDPLNGVSKSMNLRDHPLSSDKYYKLHKYSGCPKLLIGSVPRLRWRESFAVPDDA